MSRLKNPASQKNRLRFLLLIGGILCTGVLLFALKSRANEANSFRKQLAVEIVSQLGLLGDLSTLENGEHGYQISKCSLSPSQPSIVQNIALSQVSAKSHWKAHLTGKPAFSSINSERLELKIGHLNVLNQTERYSSTAAVEPEILASLKEVTVGELTVTWPHGKEQAALELPQTKMVKGSQDNWLLSAKSGSVRVPGLPEFHIVGLGAELTKHRIQIQQTNLYDANGNAVGDIKGEFESDGTIYLSGSIDHPITPLISRLAWANKISGSITGTWQYHKTPPAGRGDFEDGCIIGQFRLDDALVRELPPLIGLAELLETDTLATLKLPLTGHLNWSPGHRLTVSQLSGTTSESSLSGAIEIIGKDHQLDGQLLIGIPLPHVKNFPNGSPLFGQTNPENSQFLLPFRIFGNARQPSEDLSAQLASIPFLNVNPDAKITSSIALSKTDEQRKELLHWLLKK